MIPRSDRHRRFRLRLLEVMGLGSIGAGALAAAACGGDVIVDQSPAGTGGRAVTTGGTTGAGGASGAGGVACAVVPAAPAVLREGCIPVQGPTCPPLSTPGLLQQVAMATGVCGASGIGTCCDQPMFTSLVCGPSVTREACCYFGVYEPGPHGCNGRPFTAGGVARVAPVLARHDWDATEGDAGDTRPTGTPAVGDLDPGTRRALAEAWTRDARFEHASVASFARLALELLAVGAPASLVSDAQRAMGDEIRHAERCFALAGAYAGAPVGPGALPFEGALTRASLAEVAAAAVREGCVGETLAALAAAEARDLARDPAVRAALDAIAADEAEHAAMAWRLVAWAFRGGGAEVRAAIASAFAAPVIPGDEADPQGIDARAFHAHGRLRPGEQRAHAARALAEVVLPSAAALLASA